MRTTDLLVRQIERQIEGFMNMVAKVPDDKLNWQPSAGSRSVLSQYQEVATIIDFAWPTYSERKMEWNEEAFAQYMQSRAQFETRESLEAELKRNTNRLIEYTRGLTEEDLESPVEMPFPGEFKLCGVIQYHAWNMAYHEGQIAYILTQLGISPM